MKVAEIFADLGFKVQGQDELQKFDTTLKSIATAAREAVAALKALAGVRIPRNLQNVTSSAPRQTSGTPSGPITPLVGPPNPNGPRTGPAIPNIPPGYYASMLQGPPAPPPALAARSAANQGLPTSAINGLRMLGEFGSKVLGFTTLALTLRKLIESLKDMIRSSMQATFAVDKFTFQTGMSRKELMEWERAAAASDMKNEELMDSFRKMQQTTQQIQYTGEGYTPFAQLGIGVRQSPAEIFKQFAKRTAQMSPASAVYWGSQMGISENMVYLLRKNAGKIGGVGDQALSDKQQQAVMSLNTAYAEMTFRLSLLRDKIVSDVAPSLTWLTNQLGKIAQVLSLSTPGARTSLIHSAFNSSAGMSLPFGLLNAVMHSKPPNQVKIENHITIDGAQSPHETGKSVSEQIQRSFNEAMWASPAAYADQNR